LEDLTGRIKEYDGTCFELELKINKLEEENEHLHIQRNQLLKEIQEKQQQLIVSQDSSAANCVPLNQKICFVSPDVSERKAAKSQAITFHYRNSFAKMLLLVNLISLVSVFFQIFFFR
jgi:hypothetical protein